MDKLYTKDVAHVRIRHLYIDDFLFLFLFILLFNTKNDKKRRSLIDVLHYEYHLNQSPILVTTNVMVE